MTPAERKAYYATETVRREPQTWEKPIDSFKCRQCGKTVEIYDRFDKRVFYCSRACEKKYWRIQSQNKKCRERRSLD